MQLQLMTMLFTAASIWLAAKQSRYEKKVRDSPEK